MSRGRVAIGRIDMWFCENRNNDRCNRVSIGIIRHVDLRKMNLNDSWSFENWNNMTCSYDNWNNVTLVV